MGNLGGTYPGLSVIDISPQTIFVDSVIGNDQSGDGSSGKPFRTYVNGVRRKLGVRPRLLGDVTVQYTSVPAADDQLLIEGVDSDTGDRIFTVNGFFTVLANDTFGDAVVADRPANVPYQVQCGIFIGDTYRGKIWVDITVGPNFGVTGVVGRDLGGGLVRTPGPRITGLGVPTFAPPQAPSAGDTFEVRQPAPFNLPVILRNVSTTVVINDCQFPAIGTSSNNEIQDLNQNGYPPIFNRCLFLGGPNDNQNDLVYFQSCSFASFCYGGAYIGTYHEDSVTPDFIDYDALIEGAPFGFSLQAVSYFTSKVGAVGIFDNASGPAVAAFDGAHFINNAGVSFSGANALIYGNGNAGTTIFRLERGPYTSLGYNPASQNAPPITGPAEATSYLRLSGVNHTRADVIAGPGIVDAVHQTCMVPSV
jgi:hypothetical protein